MAEIIKAHFSMSFNPLKNTLPLPRYISAVMRGLLTLEYIILSVSGIEMKKRKYSDGQKIYTPDN